MHSRSLDIFLFGSAALLAATLLSFGWFAWPPPHGDAIAFIPAAIQYAKTGELLSPVWKTAAMLDETGRARFLNHGPYYPLLIGSLIPKANAFCAIMVIRLIDAAILLVSAFAGRRFLKSVNAWNTRGVLLVVVCLAGYCTQFAWSLRPERMALLVYTLVAMQWTRRRCCWISSGVISGLLTGFLAAVHPLAALMLALCVALLLAFRMRRTALVAALAFFGVLASSWFMALMAMSPFGIGEALVGQYRAAQLLIVGGESPPLAEYIVHFLTDPRQFLFVVPLLAGAIAATRYAFIHRSEIAAPMVFVALGVVLTFTIFYFVVRKPATSYNLVPFLVLSNAFLLHAWSRNTTRKTFLVVLFVLLLNTISFTRWLILFPIFLHEGVQLSDVRAEVVTLLSHRVGRVGVSNVGWTFTEEYERIFDYPSDVPAFQRITPSSPLIVQQFGYGLSAPRVIESHAITTNRFRSQPAKLFGITLSRLMPDYAYSVYEPEDSKSK